MKEELNHKISLALKSGMEIEDASDWVNWDNGIFIARGYNPNLILSKIKKIMQEVDPRFVITAMAFKPSGDLLVNFDLTGQGGESDA